MAAGLTGHVTVPGATVEDWLDAGQCRDCFLPAMNYRPGDSVQYMLAICNFEDPKNPLHTNFGLIASSDNHTARPGTGYKELNRREMTEAGGPATRGESFLTPPDPKPIARSEPFDLATTKLSGYQMVEFERQGSFFLTGGLAAVHAKGRNRKAIWDALQRKEVYGTSGPRILLWFDLIDTEGDALAAMGSSTRTKSPPRFRVRTAGSFLQKPGCPDFAEQALGPKRLYDLCRNECYNPSDERKKITRIEVVRIRPQQHAGEAVEKLIEDPWRILKCPDNASGCEVEFSDPEFANVGRDTLYYVRAIEEPSPVVNGGGLRCTYDATGKCIEVHPCFGDYRTPYEDDCLAPQEERARSSPIFVEF